MIPSSRNGWMSGDAIIYMTDEQPNVSVNEQKFYYISLGDETVKAIEIKPSEASDSFVVIACYQIDTDTYLVTKESQSSNGATIYKADATKEKGALTLSDPKPVENFADCINGLIRTSDNKYYLNGTEVKFKDKDGIDVSVGSSIKSVAYSDSKDVYAITSGFTVYRGTVGDSNMTFVADAAGGLMEIFISLNTEESVLLPEYLHSVLIVLDLNFLSETLKAMILKQVKFSNLRKKSMCLQRSMVCSRSMKSD